MLTSSVLSIRLDKVTIANTVQQFVIYQIGQTASSDAVQYQVSVSGVYQRANSVAHLPRIY